MKLRLNALGVAVSVLLLVSVAFAQQGRGPSTPEERKRVVDLVNKLERDPLNPDLVKEREWAIQWLIDVPDVTVSVCTEVLGPVMKTRYRYKSDLFGLHTLAAASFIIQHPDKANDDVAVNLAATKSVLAAYQAIVTKDPKSRLKELDELKSTRDSGGLEGYVAVAIARCISGPKS